MRRGAWCTGCLGAFRPTIIMHLAGAKHAPEGEIDPLSVLAVNAVGTENMISRPGRSALGW